MNRDVFLSLLLKLLVVAGGWPMVKSQHYATNHTVDFITSREANLQCNAASQLKRTIIKNPASLNKELCSYTIRPYSANVCQLLIEFQRFEFQPPTYNDDAHTLECGDHLNIGDFTLCGDNTGQHLYLPFNVAGGVKEMTLAFSLPNRWPRSSWSLVVTQLECGVAKKRRSLALRPPFSNALELLNLRTIFSAAPSNVMDVLAPPGCQQYYTQMTGTIKSFNFKNDASGYYLPNMNYVVCIAAVPSATMIEYQASKFSMSNAVETSAGYDSDCHSTVQTDGRREDYLMIPQSFVSNSVNILPTYYCGTSLQTRPALVASAPFIMYFSSDGYTDETETGFIINYRIRTVS